jgi:HD-GYP domain-containing protein (c-di-GMP phosphodiesterase class II)
LPRLTFLARFMLVTFVSAAVAAVVLAAVLESAHRQALERQETLDAVARVEQLVTPLVDRLGRGTVSQADFAQIARQTVVFGYVNGVRLYDERGRAMYPAGDPLGAAEAAAMLAKDDVSIADRGAARVAYAPLVSSDGARTYLVAVRLSRGQMAVQTTRQRWVVVGATVGCVAIVFFSLLVLAAGASRELERRRRESQATFVETLGVMARTLDLRDPYTAGHSERVAAYSRAIAEELKLSVREIRLTESAALLHDLGKIAIPDSVLFKPAKLDADERRMIEVHPSIGASLLGAIRSMEDVTPCVLHHHEKVDGSGYPDGLRGERIPLGARIIAVADAFDAMTTDRPYRRALPVSAAIAEIVGLTGVQFDETCVLAFGRLVARGAIAPPPSRDDAVFARRIEHETSR